MTTRRLLAWLPARGSWARRLLIGGASLALLCVTTVTVLWLWQQHQIDAELARIRAAGEPVTPEDLAGLAAALAKDRDATDLWLKAFRLLDAPLDLKGSLSVEGALEKRPRELGDEWPERAATESLLLQLQDLLALLHKAAHMGGEARFPLDAAGDLTTDLPPFGGLSTLSTIREAARLLSLETTARAYAGDSHGAAASIHAILMLGHSLRAVPSLLALFTGTAVEGLAGREIERCIPRLQFSDVDLLQLQSGFRGGRYESRLRTALLGERVRGIELFRALGPTGIMEDWPGGLLVSTPSDYAAYLAAMREWVAAADEPFPQALRRAKQLDSRAKPQSPRPIFRVRFAPPTQPPGDWAFVAVARSMAWVRAADTAIAIARYQRGGHRLPEGLDQLVPEFLAAVPADPFDGRPLRYKREPTGYTVYSVGEDGIDNGGRSDGLPPADVVFRVQTKKRL